MKKYQAIKKTNRKEKTEKSENLFIDQLAELFLLQIEKTSINHSEQKELSAHLLKNLG